MCVMIYVSPRNYAVIIKQLTIESHSNSTQQGFVMICAMMII